MREFSIHSHPGNRSRAGEEGDRPLFSDHVTSSGLLRRFRTRVRLILLDRVCSPLDGAFRHGRGVFGGTLQRFPRLIQRFASLLLCPRRTAGKNDDDGQEHCGNSESLHGSISRETRAKSIPLETISSGIRPVQTFIRTDILGRLAAEVK